MTEIKEIAKKNKLWIIEDCAQSHFTKYKNKFVGTIGDFGAFSFYPSKILGAFGDAGAIVTNNKKLYIKTVELARHGGLNKNIHDIEGYNSRIDGIQAAILNEKLKIINKLKSKRKLIAIRYKKNLTKLKNIELPNKNNIDHGFYLYVIKTNKRDKLKNYLTKFGIQTQIHYPKLLPFLNAYKYLKHKKNDFPNASLNQKKILSLPIYSELSTKKIDFVCNKIKDFYLK